MGCVDHLPEHRLVDDEQVGVLCADDVGGRVAVLDDRHFADTGAGLHRCDDGAGRGADVHGQAPR